MIHLGEDDRAKAYLLRQSANPVSHAASFWAWQQKVGDANAKLLLLKLADNSDVNGFCWRAHKRLAEECEMGRATVQRKLYLLRDLGLITINEKMERDGQKANSYQLKLSTAPHQAEAPPHHSDAPPASLNDAPEPSSESSDLRSASTSPAQGLVAYFVDAAGERPPGRVIGQIAQHVGQLLEEGVTVQDVQRGIDRLLARNLAPALLSNCVFEARRQAPAAPPKPKFFCPCESCGGLEFKTKRRLSDHIHVLHPELEETA